MNNKPQTSPKSSIDLIEEALEKGNVKNSYTMRESAAYYLAFQQVKGMLTSPRADKSMLERFGNFILEKYTKKKDPSVSEEDFKEFEELGKISKVEG